jgi:ABC-type multidrug transport system ATPase subunit
MIRINYLIETRNLYKQFNGNKILKGITINLKSNQIVGLIGPNGAGKTTFLKILATLIKPTSGHLRIAGFNSEKNNSDIRSLIGYCPDTLPIIEKFTGFQILNFFSEYYNVDEKTLRDIIFMSGLGISALNRNTETYSNGMKKRLLLGLTLVHNPKILLLDEPTAGLDPEGQRLLENLLLSLNKKKKLIIISSHNLYEIDRICDIILVLREGKIEQISSALDIFNEDKRHIIQISKCHINDKLIHDFLKRFNDLTYINSHSNSMNFIMKKKIDDIKIQNYFKELDGEPIEIEHV